MKSLAQNHQISDKNLIHYYTVNIVHLRWLYILKKIPGEKIFNFVFHLQQLENIKLNWFK